MALLRLNPGICKKCNKQKSHISTSGKSEGMCKPCWKRWIWKPELVFCKRCERTLPMHAKGLCNGCYNSIFHIEKVKMSNRQKYHNISSELYEQITKEGVLCGFNQITELHHLDMNQKNNSVENLTCLCPNHHKMVHHRTHQKEVFNALKEKGFIVPQGFKDDNLFKI